jgi:hypothetical protein
MAAAIVAQASDRWYASRAKSWRVGDSLILTPAADPENRDPWSATRALETTSLGPAALRWSDQTSISPPAVDLRRAGYASLLRRSIKRAVMRDQVESAMTWADVTPRLDVALQRQIPSEAP